MRLKVSSPWREGVSQIHRAGHIVSRNNEHIKYLHSSYTGEESKHKTEEVAAIRQIRTSIHKLCHRRTTNLVSWVMAATSHAYKHKLHNATRTLGVESTPPSAASPLAQEVLDPHSLCDTPPLPCRKSSSLPPHTEHLKTQILGCRPAGRKGHCTWPGPAPMREVSHKAEVRKYCGQSSRANMNFTESRQGAYHCPHEARHQVVSSNHLSRRDIVPFRTGHQSHPRNLQHVSQHVSSLAQPTISA